MASRHGFLTGCALGLGLPIRHRAGFLSAPVWNLLIHLPLPPFNWYHVSAAVIIRLRRGAPDEEGFAPRMVF